jgi:hypothetical protein
VKKRVFLEVSIKPVGSRKLDCRPIDQGKVHVKVEPFPRIKEN